jgi:hypothetical protein
MINLKSHWLLSLKFTFVQKYYNLMSDGGCPASLKKTLPPLSFPNIQSPSLHHVAANLGGARSGVGPLHHPLPDL